jgi:2-(1,2-epoxy-1,2-dihydrophenyl)acetyl-CoA isomerase
MAELDTGTTDLLATVTDGVAVVTMNRPDRRNALSTAMLDALARTLAQVEQDDDVGCVVLTGAGAAFCAGGDVKGFAERAQHGEGQPETHEHRLQRQRRAHAETALRLWRMPKPTVAVLPGAAAGAGLSLALACDLRYAAENAVLTTAFANVGLAGDFGGTWFLTQLVGAAKARELYFFSDRVGVADAERLGLLTAVFPAEKLQDEAMDRARRLASGPRVALRYMKENLNRAVTGELAECLDLEAVHHLRAFDTEDHKEAARAFVEKRPPQFTGR